MSSTIGIAERVTRHFYRHLVHIRAAFLSSLSHIEDDGQRQTYTSLLLNRLLFVCFLQQARLLDGDPRYLSHRLQLVQAQAGPDVFFRTFLLRFFYEGLGNATRSVELDNLFGNIPYLGCQLFLPHPLEQPELRLSIPDEAFFTLFTLFERYSWCLDEREGLSEEQITPELLGHIFELSINQQEMGAYYTPEDVTTYIAQAAIIPVLFSLVTQHEPDALSSTSSIWLPLRLFPGRYIRSPLGSPALLPGETEEERRERLARYQELWAKLAAGAINSIDDCVTHNLDLLTFAQDVFQRLSSAPLLLAFFQSLQELRILDPTCGSGAFLFAALTTLSALYEACLSRMHTLARQASLPDPLHNILSQIYDYRTQKDFVLHTVLTHNLYGVDLMPEAIELCKLRFSLLLLARGLEPTHQDTLSSLVRHLHTGNALVGFVSPPARQASIAQGDAEDLDRLLAMTDYGFSPELEPARFTLWKTQHQPLHWCHTFAEVIAQGGFSVILGNPPYVEYDLHTFSYTLPRFQTLSCANLYPCVIERSYQLLAPYGRLGMILPLAAFATRNMLPLITHMQNWFPQCWLSFYHFRPAMLFSGGKMASIPTAILLGDRNGPAKRFSTHIYKWKKEQRSQLFSSLSYCRITAPCDRENPHYYPKFGQPGENAIMQKILRHPCVRQYLAPTTNTNTMFYRSAGGLYWKIFLNFSWPYQTTSNKHCSFREDYDRDIFVALFNSSLFWWYYTVTFDTFNLKDYMLFGFRFSYPEDPALIALLKELCQQLMADFMQNARHLKRGQTDSYTLYARKSKALLDEVDRVLAQIYELTPEEYRFLISYDKKYRLGSQDCE